MAVKGKEVLGDAAAGAAVGSIVPGVGTAAGAIGGGLYGVLSGLFDSSDEDVANAQAAKIAALQKAGADIQAYRPELMGMEQAGKQEQLAQFGDTRSLLAAMNGQKPAGTTYGYGGGQPALGRMQAPPDTNIAPGMLGHAKVDQGQGSMPITPLSLRRR